MDIAPRISLVTLGVADVARARAFYEALGFVASSMSNEDVAFFKAGGTALGLFGRDALAHDANVAPSGDGFRAVSLAINLESEAAVDAFFVHARACGAEVKKNAQKVFWGGYSGYFSDPDGHLWEVAHNPFAPLDANGQMTLPD